MESFWTEQLVAAAQRKTSSQGGESLTAILLKWTHCQNINPCLNDKTFAHGGWKETYDQLLSTFSRVLPLHDVHHSSKRREGLASSGNTISGLYENLPQSECKA